MGIFDRLFGRRRRRKKTEKYLDNLRHSGATLEMECPACGGRALGRITSYGIVEFECDTCGWSGSVGT